MSNPLLSRFISHEFRTPLNAIIGFTGTLLMQLPGPVNRDQEKQLRIIQTSARTLLSLIDDLTESEAVISSPVETGQTHTDSNPRQRTAKARVLLIEDDPNSQKLMVYLLNAMGYEPLVAESGERGLAMARQEMPDLILCDVELPVIDGYQVAKNLKLDPMLRDIPLVAVTASARNSKKYPTDEFDYHLPKPIRSESLAAQLQGFITDGVVQRFRPLVPKSPPEAGARPDKQ